MGWENSLGLSPYNNRFRALRKNMAKVLGSQTSSARFNSLQEKEAGHFLLHILDDPNSLTEHIRKYVSLPIIDCTSKPLNMLLKYREAGSVILKIAYGYTTEPHGRDPLVELAGQAMDQFGRAGVPGTWLVDMLPFSMDLQFSQLTESCIDIQDSETLAGLVPWSRIQTDWSFVGSHVVRAHRKTVCFCQAPDDRGYQ